MDTDLYKTPEATLLDENNNEETQLHELKAFVGPNDKFYLTRWRQFKSKDYFTFNIGAFFLTGSWMLYRKMYKSALILSFIAIIETILSEYIFLNYLNYPETPVGYNVLSTLLYSVIIGKTGNYLYYLHTMKTINQVKRNPSGKIDYIEELKTKGGRSLVSAIVGSVIIFLITLGAFAAYDYLMGVILNSGSGPF